MVRLVENKFVHNDLKLVEPPFHSKLTDLIMDLNFLRKKDLRGSTPQQVFSS